MDWQRGMREAIAYIEDNLEGEIDFAAAARRAGVSTWEFQRLFSFLAQIPLGEYVRLRRLTLAAEELRAGCAQVIDIGLKYGYASPAAFARAFRQWYGISPTAARQRRAPLKSYPRLTFEFGESGRNDGMNGQNDMVAYANRGYYVRENAPVYFTPDMDRTSKWFREVLGWYGDIVSKDADGRGNYGCVFDYPGELIVSHLTPFRGIHLFAGEPSKGVVGFMMVQGLEKLRAFVLANGWEQVSEIERQPWGAAELHVTTIDGSILRFFETTA
jgi:AraC family transcriptional regulator